MSTKSSKSKAVGLKADPVNEIMTVAISNKLTRRVRQRARQAATSVSALVRQFIEQGLDREK